ncbi:MAG: IS1595 family transposase [Solirubrobacteraceae bacterium]|jgi:transposase-like protein
MPPVNRDQPKRAESSSSQFSLMEFMREFPDDATCLEWLWRNRYSDDGSHAECPSCERVRKFHKVNDRPAWDCDSCGHHMHPLAGTIFEKSSTSLHLWFFAIHLMTSTRCGVSAKQLERELGVTYKTAWRMANLIRNELMTPDDELLSGDVEVDETWIGGKPRAADIRRHQAASRPKQAARKWRDTGDKKTPVFGAVERKGRIRAVALHDSRDLKGVVATHVLPESVIFSDEFPAYVGLHRTYRGHHRIRHKEHVYVSGDVHTNTIEGFFGNLKNGLRGTYHAVSRKWLQSYLDEFTWRYNHRHDERAMFRLLLSRAASGR